MFWLVSTGLNDHNVVKNYQKWNAKQITAPQSFKIFSDFNRQGP